MIETLVQFGVAGLMGALWVWERTYSRKRERQLSESHRALMERDRELEVMVRLVRQNTRAMVGFERVHERMCELLERMNEEFHNKRAA
ncbi:MAG: hypothetical protein GC159_14370 [Phycisphaera sp.]|nr:hypothetical protein [Phycisphaera sp.]